MMDPDGSIPLPALATTILLIDGNGHDRTYYADRLKFSIPDCVVLEAKDGKSGLEVYKSRRVDCIVHEVYLPDMSGFELLVALVPLASRPPVAVLILTRKPVRGLRDLARANGAQELLVKQQTSGEELAQVILKAIAVVGPTHKDRQAQ
jgi:DNA-binding NarL/FixJ family response regulator